jgi:hypothetical protein
MKVKQAEKDGVRLSIHQDESPFSPREDDNLGKMVCWHKRYELGDKHDYADPEDFKPEEHAVCLALYLYDHSGITISCKPFSCPWDSGQIGWIYCDVADIVKEYGKNTKANRDKAERLLRSEVETYDTYLRGDVYGFVLEKADKCGECGHTEWEEIDSCWGFYGDDLKENGMLEHAGTEYAPLFDLLERV